MKEKLNKAKNSSVEMVNKTDKLTHSGDTAHKREDIATQPTDIKMAAWATYPDNLEENYLAVDSQSSFEKKQKTWKVLYIFNKMNLRLEIFPQRNLWIQTEK